MRLDSWIEAITNGLNGDTHSTSIERKIKLCFGRNNTQFKGTNGKNKRYNKPIGGLRLKMHANNRETFWGRNPLER
jgi:hypothetical protein